MKKNIAIIFLIFLFAAACSSGKPARAKKPVLKVGADRIEAAVLEQETDNIPYWLEEGASHRVLVRVSFHDGLLPVKDEALKELKGLAEKKELKALAQKGNSMDPSASYSPDSLVSLANKLNIVDEVYWVIPKFENIDAQDIEGFRKYLKDSIPGSGKEADSFKLNGAVGEGRINGIPVKLMSLLDLPPIEKPALLQVDLSFFSTLYKNEKETRVLSLVSAFMNTLKEKNISADLVTISLGNAGGVPLRMRFVGRYLAELFQNPGMTDKEPPALWSERADAWRVGQKSPKQAIPIYKGILKDNPRDAATRYDLAEAYFQSGDFDDCRDELKAAAGIDPGYALGYGEFAARLAQAGRKDKAEAFLAAARDVK